MPRTKSQSNTTTYRDVLKEAYEAVLTHKFLWFFGFFAAFLGVAGEFEPLFNNYTNIGERTEDILSLSSFYEDGFFWTFFNSIGSFFSAYPWQAFLFLLLLFVVGILMVWLAIVSQVALFNAAHKIKKGQPVHYSDGYRVGNQHFGSVLLLNLLVKVVLYGLFVVIGTPIITWFLINNNLLGGIIFVICVFLLFVPAWIIVSFILKYAIAFIAIKNKKAMESLKMGWELFRKNWMVSLEMALIVLIIGLGVALFIVICMGLSAVPFIVIGYASLLIDSTFGFSFAVIMGTLVWFLLLSVLGAAYVSFQYTAWAFLFLKLTENKAQSKFMRWVSRWTGRKKGKAIAS